MSDQFTKSMYIIIIKELDNGNVDISMAASPDMRWYGGGPASRLPLSHSLGMNLTNIAEETLEQMKRREPLR